MNDVLSAFIERFTKTEPSENEYLGEDGLFFCRKCHTPTQCRIEVGGVTRIVSCICRCRQEELAKRKQEDEKAERLEKIRRLKANGIQDKALLGWTFAIAEDSPTVRMAERYVEQWPEVKSRNLGLLLWGDVGTGKSFIAACIANALMEKGIPVLMTNFSKILNQMGGMYSDERYRYIASFSAYDLLVIDDLGIERSIADTELKGFERVAKKYGVDFAIRKDNSQKPPRYTVFFKARDQDALTAAYEEYAAQMMTKKQRPSVRKKLAKFSELAASIPRKIREKKKERGR